MRPVKLPRPRILWRYIFKEVLVPVLLGLMVYVLVFLTNALFELAELAIKKEIPVRVVLKLLFLILPRVLEMTLPMAALLGILIGIGRLSADSELVALRASGASYAKVLAPVLTLAVGCWALSSILMLQIEPRARYVQKRLFNEQLYLSDVRREIKPRVFFEEVPGLLLYADEVYQGGEFLDRVFLHQIDTEGREVVTLARRGQIDYNKRTGLTQFYLESGTNHTLTPGQPESYQISHFEKQRFVREPDDAFRMRLGLLAKPTPKNYSEQSLAELGESARQAQRMEFADPRNRVVGVIMATMHERFALPFACLAFSILGLPLGIANRRGGKAAGFSVSVGIAITYWLLYSSGQRLVMEGRLSPWIGMWSANVLLLILGSILLVLRERSEDLGLGAVIVAGTRRLARRVMARVRNRSASDRRVIPMPAASIRDVSEEDRALPSLWKLGSFAVLATGGIAASYLTPFLTVGLILLALVFLFSTTLDRHVLWRFLGIGAGCVLSFLTLYVVYESVRLLDDLVERNQPTSMAVAYLGYKIPWMISQVLPMSCLVACLLTYGLMSRFNEVTAVKASGTSVYRLAVPVVMATLAISILGYVNYDYLVPYANQKATQVRDVIQGKSPRSYQVGDRRWVFGDGGRLYNFRNYVSPPVPVLPTAGTGTFEGFSVYYLDPASFEMKARIYAKTAAFRDGHWLLQEGWSREFRQEGEVFERFAEKTIDLPEGPSFFIKDWKSPEQMNYAELNHLVGDLSRKGYDTQEMRVDLYSKTSFPLVPLTLVIIGLPFCFKIGKRGSLYGVGIAILIAALYFLAFSATSALGETGMMPAFLAAWAPNILFAGAGAYLLLHTAT